jgi:hypothetical protein
VAVVRQRPVNAKRGEVYSEGTRDSAIEVLLEEMFSTRFLPRSYKRDVAAI